MSHRRLLSWAGFTLVEMLVALAVFSVLSVIVANGLKNVISFQEAALVRAKQWQEWQWAFLLFSRDVEQALNRPVRTPQGQMDAAFIGAPSELVFTHFGRTPAAGESPTSDLQRTRYTASDQTFARVTYPVLDRAEEKGVTSRLLASGLSNVRFEYYSKRYKRFYPSWPLKEDPDRPLPDAVRVYATLSHYGQMSQLYVIPAASS